MVAGIIVLYNPNKKIIFQVIETLQKQIDVLILVNNGSPIEIELQNVILRDLGENKGIAYAQNVGVDIARELGAKYILFSDQDTVYPENYISEMKNNIKRFGDKAILAGSIGYPLTSVIDNVDKDSYLIMELSSQGYERIKNITRRR